MASIGFRWLDILEKEFDKAFVELDLTVGEWESEEPDVVFNIRQKLCTLSSCFAQLTHKAQTIFQNSAKIEAELIHMRAELVESKSKREVLEQELHNLLLQLHSAQLSHLPDSLDGRKQDPNFKPDVNNIKKKLQAELRFSPVHISKNGKGTDEIKLSPMMIENAQQRIENAQLMTENASLRNAILALNSEVYGAKLAAKYLDKELAGRIQQLQLLGKEMRGELRDKLWRQLESEILLQRHKTVVRACRRNSIINGSEKSCAKPRTTSVDGESVGENSEGCGEIRKVVVKRKPGQGLGISITGGREHGVPILISELEARGPAAMTEKLFIGDAILFVNNKDIRQACHKEAVDILQQQTGDCLLQVQYIAADDSDNSLEEDSYDFRFFENLDANGVTSTNGAKTLDVINTPTAPRTPESSVSRCTSRASIYNFYETTNLAKMNKQVDVNKNTSNKLNIYQKVLLDSKITNSSYSFSNENVVKNQPNQRGRNYEFTTEINQNILEKDTETTTNPKSPDNKDLIEFNKNSNFLNKIIPFINKDDISVISDILLADNSKDLIRFDEVKGGNDNFNSSLNSLTSDNFSSPMQTSTDVILDSEILSTDMTSNDSQSPKNLQTDIGKTKSFNYLSKFANVNASNDSICNPKSDQSLLNSDESCDSSPVHKNKRDYRKAQRKHKKKYFGVKTLQSIFNKHDGYSDVSTTASDYEDEKEKVATITEVQEREKPKVENEKSTLYKCKAVYTDTSPQFEENVHNILSDIFVKNFPNTNAETLVPTVQKSMGNKKYFSFHGQNLRVGKALRLCPNQNSDFGNEQRKEKLLARYVYNSNASTGDGIGDPFFGTPV